MAEHGRTELSIIGAGDFTAQVESNVWATIEEEKKKRIEGITLAELTPDQKARFETVEKAAAAFINAKLNRLELPSQKIEGVIYATNHKKDRKEGYYDPLVGGVLYANKPVTDFDKYSSAAHLVSHLSTRSEVRRYMSAQDRNAPRQTWAMGSEQIGDKKVLGEAIEEGMAVLDQVDFFNGFLNAGFPDEFEQRQKLANSPDIKKQVEEAFSQRLYGEISSHEIAPFVVLETDHKSHRIIGARKPKPTLDVLRLQEYLFAKKLCVTLGKSISRGLPDSDGQIMKLGRDLIERDRYRGTHDSYAKIVEVMSGAIPRDRTERSNMIHGESRGLPVLHQLALGSQRARTLFNTKGYDKNEIDVAMATFRYIVPETPPLIPLNQPGRKSPLLQRIESTPVIPPTPVIQLNSAPREEMPAAAREPESAPRPNTEEDGDDLDEPPPAVQAAPVVAPQVSTAGQEAQPNNNTQAREQREPRSRRERQPVDTRVGDLRARLRVEEGKLERAKNRLAEILERYPDREDESAEAERQAIELSESRIYDLSMDLEMLNQH